MRESKRKGLIIVFEGPNFSGKTTAQEKAAQHLCFLDIPCCIVNRPSDTELGRKIKAGEATWEECLEEAVEIHKTADRWRNEGYVVLMARHYQSQLCFQRKGPQPPLQVSESGNRITVSAEYTEIENAIRQTAPMEDAVFYFIPLFTELSARMERSERKDRPIQMPLYEQINAYMALYKGQCAFYNNQPKEDPKRVFLVDRWPHECISGSIVAKYLEVNR